MKAALFHGAGLPMTIDEVEIGQPGPNEVLIRTVASGVCHSDLHYLDGTIKALDGLTPVVLGHEAAGMVEAVGSAVRTVRPGDHVVTCLSAYCGHCEFCLTGRMSICRSPETQRDNDEEPRLRLRGKRMHQFVNLSAFAERMLVHEYACVAIRKDMPLDRAALLGCAVTAGAGAVINTANVRPGETVAILGCGGIGLSAINGAAIAGAGRIIAIDTLDNKLALARTFGATDVINAKESDPVAAVLEMTHGGVEHSFECIGNKTTVTQAYNMLRKGGTATIIGVLPQGTNIEFEARSLLMGRRVQGAAMGSNRFPVDIPRMVDFYLAGKLHLDQLISRRRPLDQINEAFEDLRGGSVARSVIVFEH